MPDMLFILGLALLLFGPKKLPELARQIGRIKRSADEMKAQLQSEVEKLQAEAEKVVPSEITDIAKVGNPLMDLREKITAAVQPTINPTDRP